MSKLVVVVDFWSPERTVFTRLGHGLVPFAHGVKH